MADTGGISDYAILNQTKHENPGSGSAGWASLGAALGGGTEVQGANAYDRGMQVGASTIDALAQARARVTANDANQRAAAIIRNPQVQSQLGYTPEIGDYAATVAERGGDPREVAGMLKENQDRRFQSTLGDALAPQNQREAAQAALAPGSVAPKAEGPLGSVFRPLAQTPQGAGSTTVSPLQTQVANSEIGQHNASANAENALATQRQNNPQGAGGKPPAGYRWQIDPDTMDLKLDNTGRPIAEAIPGLPPKGEGAISARYHENMLGGAEGAGNEIRNIMKIGPTSSVGFAGTSPGHGLLNSVSNNLGTALSSTEQQEMKKSYANVGRFIGAVENGGRPIAQGQAGPLQSAIENLPSDTEFSRLYGTAMIRQALEVQQPRIHASGASQAVKDEYDKVVDQAKKDMPFTVGDVIDFQRAPPGQTIESFLKGKQGGGAPAAAGGPPPGLKLVN